MGWKGIPTFPLIRIAYDVHEPLISVVLTENPIPEPAGLLVFAGALLGLFTARKYRKA